MSYLRSSFLAQFDNSLQIFQKQSTNALSEVRLTTEFSLLVAKTLSDDYQAFEQVRQITFIAASPLRKTAANAVNVALTRAEIESLNSETLAPAWNAIGIDPNTNSLDQLRQFFFTQPNNSFSKLF